MRVPSQPHQLLSELDESPSWVVDLKNGNCLEQFLGSEVGYLDRRPSAHQDRRIGGVFDFSRDQNLCFSCLGKKWWTFLFNICSSKFLMAVSGSMAPPIKLRVMFSICSQSMYRGLCSNSCSIISRLSNGLLTAAIWSFLEIFCRRNRSLQKCLILPMGLLFVQIWRQPRRDRASTWSFTDKLQRTYKNIKTLWIPAFEDFYLVFAFICARWQNMSCLLNWFVRDAFKWRGNVKGGFANKIGTEYWRWITQTKCECWYTVVESYKLVSIRFWTWRPDSVFWAWNIWHCFLSFLQESHIVWLFTIDSEFSRSL